MIDDFLLQSAVNIRRKYLKVTNNLKLYEDKAKELVSILETTISKLNELNSSNNNTTSSDDKVEGLLKILKDVDEESLRLKYIIDPINKNIEELSKEEVVLYNTIKEKYIDLSDDEIIKEIQNRLSSEDLL
jgi:Lhr-like helicase